MSWTQVGSVNVGPQDREVLVGSFSLQPGDDTLWVRVQSMNPPGYFKYAYGLLTWRSSFGKELGTVKVYGEPTSEVFRLGEGTEPLDKSGQLFFTPTAYNRRWISIENPPVWTVNFEAKSGSLVSGDPVLGTRASLVVLADLVGAGVSYAINGGFAKLKLSPNARRLWPTFDSPQLTPTTQPSFPSPATPKENSN